MTTPDGDEARSAGEAVLVVEGLSKVFPGPPPVTAVRDCTFEVRRGEFVAITGPSGSGKTTLLSLLGLLESPTAGRYLLDGVDVIGLSDSSRCVQRAHRIGFVFQAFHLLPHLDAARNVAVPLLLKGAAPGAALERAAAMLARVGLASRANAWPRELSGGEQQRVALARALVHAPPLVLADEPTGNLDPATAAQALALIATTVESSGAALVLVTHSVQAAAIAHRRLRLVAGRLCADDGTQP